MPGLKCDKVIDSRAKDGKPSCCGKPAAPYRMVGELTVTGTALCEKHAPDFQQLGHRLERPDGTTLPNAASSAGTATAEIAEMDDSDQLPLFEAKCDG
jgi:hypothetical protein